MLFYKKNDSFNSFLSFHSLIFHRKILRRGWGEGGGATKTHVNWWSTCRINRNEQGGGWLSKIRSFKQTHFLNDPKVFSLQLRSIC